MKINKIVLVFIIIGFLSISVLLINKIGRFVSIPAIHNATIEMLSDLTELIHIEGKNFSARNVVLINGTIQERAIIHDDRKITVKLHIPEWDRIDSYVLTVSENQGSDRKSNEFILKTNTNTEVNKPVVHKSSIEYLKQGYLVAHAMGGLDGMTYTNSKEAFVRNYEAGHRLFECDFQFTSDDVLATMHDRSEMIRTFAEESCVLPYTIMSFEDVCKLMLEYTDAYIITDTKYHDNFYAIKRTFDYFERIIKETAPELAERLIIQVYSQEMYYYLIDNYNFNSYIYTLYASEDTNQEVLEFVSKTGIPVVTIPAERAVPEFVADLKELGVYSFAHTVNNDMEILNLLQGGLYGIYTDFTDYDGLSLSAEARYSAYIGELSDLAVNEAFFIKYMSNLNNPDYMCVISINGNDRNMLTEDMETALMELGISLHDITGINTQYLAAAADNELVFEKTNADYIEHSWSVNSVDFSITSEEDSLSFYINGTEYTDERMGIHIYVYDIFKNRFVSSVCFKTLENFRIYSNSAYYSSRDNLINYLDEINNEKYIIALSVNDEGSNALDEDIQERLNNMGLSIPLIGKYQHSYAAVINNGSAVYEDCSANMISAAMLVDEWLIDITSAGYTGGSLSSIKIDGQEYSQNKRGLNIVLFDKLTGAVVDSVCFDTYDRLQSSR